jgi:hypothetical protein
MRFVAVVMLLVNGASAGAQDVVLQTEPRVAFYEAAPRSLAASMKKAVERYCGGDAIRRAEQVAWLCAETPLRCFRGVDVLGNKQRTGLTCESKAVTPNLRYYTEDMFNEESHCAPLAYLADTGSHEVDLED